MKVDPDVLDFIELAFGFLGPFIIVAIFGKLYLIYNLRGRNVLSLGESIRRGDSPLYMEMIIYLRRDQLTRFERIVLYSQIVAVCVLAVFIPAIIVILMWFLGPQLFAKFYG